NISKNLPSHCYENFTLGMKLIQILLVAFGLQEAFSINCYSCTNDENIDDDHERPFDLECGHLQYEGISNSSDYNYCFIELWDNGAVSRGIFDQFSGYEDGDCQGYGHPWGSCICTSDLCNTGNFCEHCNFPWVPPTTMAFTSTDHITTVPTKTTTSNESTSTPITTTTGGSGLICYHCVNCSNIEDTTPVIQDSAFSLCVSTVFLNSGEVVRGGTKEQRPDGECEQYNYMLTCWCSLDFCNNKTFAELKESLREILIPLNEMY
ncbi:unnamed protein product, partial [Meganyctiphanes norvegica]